MIGISSILPQIGSGSSASQGFDEVLDKIKADPGAFDDVAASPSSFLDKLKQPEPPSPEGAAGPEASPEFRPDKPEPGAELLPLPPGFEFDPVPGPVPEGSDWRAIPLPIPKPGDENPIMEL